MYSLLHALFHEMKEFKDMPLEVISPGRLNLASGQVVVYDPYLYEKGLPITGQVCPGKYPLKVCQANSKSEKMILAAMIVIENETPFDWAPAYQPEVRTAGQMKGKSFLDDTCIVDSNTGGLMDFETGKLHERYDKELKSKGRTGGIQDIFNKEFEPLDAAWFSYFPCPEINRYFNAFCFKLPGDGSCRSYWGRKANKELVCLVVDFAGIVRE